MLNHLNAAKMIEIFFAKLYIFLALSVDINSCNMTVAI